MYDCYVESCRSKWSNWFEIMCVNWGVQHTAGTKPNQCLSIYKNQVQTTFSLHINQFKESFISNHILSFHSRFSNRWILSVSSAVNPSTIDLINDPFKSKHDLNLLLPSPLQIDFHYKSKWLVKGIGLSQIKMDRKCQFVTKINFEK